MTTAALRLRYTKHGKVVWTSHRDVARIWERALRRAGLPLVYSEGFSPRARLSFGLALPTGASSDAEFLDVALAESEGDAREIAARLGRSLPCGIDAVDAAWLPQGEPSLQEAVTSCSWRIDVDVPGGVAGLGELIARAMSAVTLPIVRERKGRSVTDDVRPAILALSTGAPGGTEAGEALDVELTTQPRGVRPSELETVLRAVAPSGGQPVFRRCRRTNQWITRDGVRREPLPAATPSAPYACGRAS